MTEVLESQKKNKVVEKFWGRDGIKSKQVKLKKLFNGVYFAKTRKDDVVRNIKTN